MIRTIGLLINPVAGVGGPAGLKGSDGPDVQAAALARGAQARSGERAVAALTVVAAAHPHAEIITADGAMGADAVRQAGLAARVVYQADSPSTGADTTAAALAIEEAGADLILFVGGDGTARDVASALRPWQPMLGVPAGVKMYSGCFAVSPTAAGALAAHWLGDEQIPLTEREVLDVDEEQIRHGRVDPKLFALVQVPFVLGRTQSRKSATPVSEAAAVQAAARGAVAAMNSGTHYLLGPGGTTREIARQLGIEKTPLGVDVVRVDAARKGELVLADASEQQLLDLIAGRALLAAEPLPASDSSRVRSNRRVLTAGGDDVSARAVTDGVARATGVARTQAVVTVIGGQGFLLGRGNQQISASVVAALGENPLLVVATEQKLALLLGQPLLVDTGNPVVDRSLAGYIRVITGVGSAGVYPVTAPEVTEPVSAPVSAQASPQISAPVVSLTKDEGAQSCV
ncbi:ATP-NAD kinase family protein [Leifsonia kafniensis]|uniref:ATP-NAD kinase family protein n=1 Tax=Leifsonia kafniensis TaxID=475957 RepID=A0ABP7KFL0_9MICO